jgi:hypothetical protein
MDHVSSVTSTVPVHMINYFGTGQPLSLCQLSVEQQLA